MRVVKDLKAEKGLSRVTLSASTMAEFFHLRLQYRIEIKIPYLFIKHSQTVYISQYSLEFFTDISDCELLLNIPFAVTQRKKEQ